MRLRGGEHHWRVVMFGLYNLRVAGAGRVVRQWLVESREVQESSLQPTRLPCKIVEPKDLDVRGYETVGNASDESRSGISRQRLLNKLSGVRDESMSLLQRLGRSIERVQTLRDDVFDKSHENHTGMNFKLLNLWGQDR